MVNTATRKKGFVPVMILYILGIFMGAIDTGIVAPARTIIQSGLGVDDKTGIWMITAFTLAYACSIPVLGKLADRLGRKPVYIAAIFLFGAGSLLCGLSEHIGGFPMLIIGRVIQAFGGGGIVPLATAEFGTSFPPEKRGLALGLIGGVYGIANIMGSTIGSGILDAVGVNNWQWLFYVNLPISAIIIIAGIFTLPKGEKVASKKLDVWGTLVLLLMILSLLYGLNNLDFFDFGNTITQTNVYPFLIAFAVLVPVFILIERRVADPILDLTYFKKRNILITFILSFIAGVCLMGLVFVPQFSENGLRIASGKGGYFVTILGLFSGIGAPLSGKLIDKYGPKLILLIGFGITLAGALFIVFIATNYTTVATIIASLVIVGVGLGFVMGTPLNYMMLANTKKEESNSALASLSLMRSIGTTIGPILMIGFIAQAGIAAKDNLMNILPPVSAINVQADASLTQPIKDDFLIIKNNIPKTDADTAALKTKLDELEALNNAVAAADKETMAAYDKIKTDPQFKSMISKMNMPDTTSNEAPDFTEQKKKLDNTGGITAAEIDERLKMLDTGSTKMDFDMKNGTLPDDVLKDLQSADVTNITARTVNLVDRIFHDKTPAVITDIQNGIQEGIDGVKSGIDGIWSGRDGITEGLTGIQSGVDGVGKGIDGIDTGLSGMNKGLKGMNSAVSGMNKGLSGMKSARSGMEKGLTGINAGIAGMETGLAQQKGILAGLQAQLATATDPVQIGKLKGQITGIQAGITALTGQLNGAKAQKAQMEAGIKALNTQISSMQKGIRSIRNAKPQLTNLMSLMEKEKGLMADLQKGMKDCIPLMQDALALLNADLSAMQDALPRMEKLKASIPSTFQIAKETYSAQVRDKGGEIESVFQSTLNEGFRQMYYAVSAFALIAFIILLFYRRDKGLEKLAAKGAKVEIKE